MIFNKPKYKYIFFLIDLIILTLSFVLAVDQAIPGFWNISKAHPYFSINHAVLYIVLSAILLFSFRLNNLYKRNVVTSRYRQFILVIKSLLAGFIVSLIFMFFSSVEYFMLFGKTFITYYFLFNFVCFSTLRGLLYKSIYYLLARQHILQTRVLIVGGDKAARYVAKELKSDPFADFVIVGFLDDYKKPGEKIKAKFKNMGKLNDLPTVLTNHKVDEILIAIDHAPYERLIYIVETCLKAEKPVRIYSDLLNVIAEKMDVEHYSKVPVITLEQKPLDAPDWGEKRVVDVILAVIAIVLLSPLLLLVAAGIKLSSKGPVIFHQKRIGKGGRPFNFYKFRSMHVGNSSDQHKEYVQNFIKNNIECKTEEIQIFKIQDDPRIFKFGKFIRKTSIDEFPQFFNVLKGDMSLVGPRPCLDYEWECYEEWHKKRLNILPGCTGLWQALGRSSVTFEEMVILDLYYISNMSIWMDLKIVLQTFPVIFLAKGGH